MSKRLHLYGKVHIAGGGFFVEVEPALQGINPSILVMKITFVPTGESPSDQVIDEFYDWPQGFDYTEVSWESGAGPTAALPPIHEITVAG